MAMPVTGDRDQAIIIVALDLGAEPYRRE